MKSSYCNLSIFIPFVLVLFLSTTFAMAQNTVNYSDTLLSKNVEPISGALKKLGSAKGVYYNYRSDEFISLQLDTLRHVGIMAQGIEKIMPELVNTNANGYKSVDYEEMVPLLLEAIKDLTMQNKELTSKYIYLVNSLSQSGVLDKNYGKKPEEKK